MLLDENKYVMLVMNLSDFTKNSMMFHALSWEQFCNAGHEITQIHKDFTIVSCSRLKTIL